MLDSFDFAYALIQDYEARKGSDTPLNWGNLGYSRNKGRCAVRRAYGTVGAKLLKDIARQQVTDATALDLYPIALTCIQNAHTRKSARTVGNHLHTKRPASMRSKIQDGDWKTAHNRMRYLINSSRRP